MPQPQTKLLQTPFLPQVMFQWNYRGYAPGPTLIRLNPCMESITPKRDV